MITNYTFFLFSILCLICIIARYSHLGTTIDLNFKGVKIIQCYYDTNYFNPVCVTFFLIMIIDYLNKILIINRLIGTK